jgi:type VI protein secretion system component Hcp
MNMRGVALAAVCVVSSALVMGSAQAASDIFLEISGVQGEVVTPAAFANQIGILSMSFGGSKPCASGSLSLSELTVMKQTDKATVDFSVALRDHTVYPTATFRFTNPADQVYQVYQLTNALITSLQTAGSAGGGRTTESVSFTFSTLLVTYTYIDGAGKPGTPESMTLTAAGCP